MQGSGSNGNIGDTYAEGKESVMNPVVRNVLSMNRTKNFGNVGAYAEILQNVVRNYRHVSREKED